MAMDWRQNSIILPDWKLAFFVQEKCASSSIKWALRRTFEKKFEVKPGHWAPIRDKISITDRRFTIIPGWRDYLRITVVRNPWDRIGSAWANKITDKAVFLKELDSQDYFEPGMSFPEFVRKVCRRPDQELDRHLHHQSRRMFEGEILLPRVFYRVETLAQDWDKLRHQVDFFTNGEVKIVPLPRLNVSEKIVPWTHELIEKVGHRYHADLDLFHHRKVEYHRPTNAPF